MDTSPRMMNLHKLVGTTTRQMLGPAANKAAACSSWDDRIELPAATEDRPGPYRRQSHYGINPEDIPEKYSEISQLLQQPVKTKGIEDHRVRLPLVTEGKYSLNNYEKVSPELIPRIEIMQNNPDYQRTIIDRTYWRPYPVLQKQDCQRVV